MLTIGKIGLFWHGYKDINFPVWRLGFFVKYWKPTMNIQKADGGLLTRILWICGLSLSW